MGIIIELKHTATGKQASQEEIETAPAAAAKEAFAQMQENDYDAGLRQAGIANICQIAIAFHGKLLHIQHGMGDYIFMRFINAGDMSSNHSWR